MKTKLLVFFGIVVTGVITSVITLSKRDRNELDDDKVPQTISINSGGETKNETGRASAVKEDASSDRSSHASSNGGSRSMTEKVNPPSGQSTVSPNLGTDSPASLASSTAPAVVFQTGTKSAVGVVGEMANAIQTKDFNAFMAAAGDATIPSQTRERLKSIVENPNLKLDKDRPFWEVAKTRDSVRWLLNFVPVTEGSAKPEVVVMDITKVASNEYKVTSVSLSPTIQEVVNAMQNGNTSGSFVDSLNVAHAFSDAVLSGDFVSARKMCSPNVTDERIAGLMIALEDGKFVLREDRPLIVTFSRDAVSWVLSRVSSSRHSSEFALELENWKINGLTFGKVIASLAREVDGPYSPIVEDPSGGESLVVYFEFDESGLTSRADNQLKIVGSILKQDSSRKIRITGHADSLGSDDYNRGLSSKRAESIRQAIVARGANPSQVITEGFGETRPRKPNFKEDGTDNPVGRSENRRAEVYLDF